MELLDPVEGVTDDELADRLGVLAVIVDGCTPRGLVPVGKKGGRVDG
jgi:hypothetical protein